jgi:hypothetical protein
MSDGRNARNPMQVVMGLMILAIGLLFLLDNLGAVDAWDFADYWPVAVIVAGAVQVWQARTWHRYATAIVWILFGVWMLGRNLGFIRISIFHFWPALLAAIGALLVFRGWRGYDAQYRGWHGDMESADQRPGDPLVVSPPGDGWVTTPPGGDFSSPAGTARGAGATPFMPSAQDPNPPGATRRTSSGESVLNAFAIMGGFTRRLISQDFKGGVVVAIMGGATLDFRNASIAQGEAVLDVVAFWGGIEMKVPDDWVIVSQVFPLMGGFEDRTGPRSPGTHKRLVIRGLALMGGVEVKT